MRPAGASGVSLQTSSEVGHAHHSARTSIVGAGRRPDSGGGLPSWPPRLHRVRGGLRRDVGEPRPGADRGGRRRARGCDLARLRQRDRFRRREDQSAGDGASRTASGAQQPDVQLDGCHVSAVPAGAPGPPDTCVQVDAFRNQARGNALPMFFGNLVGVSSQGVRATATAQIVTADTTECLKPWAILDRWDEYDARRRAGLPEPRSGLHLASSTFDKYSDGKGTNPPQETGSLRSPECHIESEPGFACRTMKVAGSQSRSATTATRVSSGGSGRSACRDSTGRTAADVYRDNIQSCNGLPSSYAEPGTVCPTNIGNRRRGVLGGARVLSASEPGNMVGPTRQGIETLIARDPGAS